MATTSGHATNVRWVIVALLALTAGLTYIDRLNLGIVAKFVQEEYKIDTETMGWILGAFSLGLFVVCVPDQSNNAWRSGKPGPSNARSKPPRTPLVPETLSCSRLRENNEGEYSNIGGRLYEGTPEETAVQQTIFTRRGVERVLRYAFELARKRKRHLTSATKSNGIIYAMPFGGPVL